LHNQEIQISNEIIDKDKFSDKGEHAAKDTPNFTIPRDISQPRVHAFSLSFRFLSAHRNRNRRFSSNPFFTHSCFAGIFLVIEIFLADCFLYLNETLKLAEPHNFT
jgi:hypothetical protein